MLTYMPFTIAFLKWDILRLVLRNILHHKILQAICTYFKKMTDYLKILCSHLIHCGNLYSIESVFYKTIEKA